MSIPESISLQSQSLPQGLEAVREALDQRRGWSFAVYAAGIFLGRFYLSRKSDDRYGFRRGSNGSEVYSCSLSAITFTDRFAIAIDTSSLLSATSATPLALGCVVNQSGSMRPRITTGNADFLPDSRFGVSGEHYYPRIQPSGSSYFRYLGDGKRFHEGGLDATEV